MSATFYLARMCAAFFIGFAILVATGCGGKGGGGGDPGGGGNPPTSANGVATCLPASVAFGNQTVNVATAPTTVTITNTGSQDLNLAALTVTGSKASAFTITQPAQLVLAPNATTTFTVIFTPTVEGAYSATVNIPVTDTKDRGTTVRVTGNGVSPVNGAVTPSPTALDFGTIVINETSAAQTVTVTNTGNSTLTFSSSASGAVTVTGAGAAAFQVTQMGVTTLAPSASATFTVVFQPLAIQQYTATVLITALSPASSGSVTVTGIGRGPYRVDELVSLIAGDGTNMITVGLYDFGIVEPPLTATQSFTLTNIAPDGRTVNLKQLYTTLPSYIRIVLNSQITNGGFTSTDPDPILEAGRATTFVMTYTSSTIERVSALCNLELLGAGNLNWTVSAGMQDRLYIIGNGLPIEDGDQTPRVADFTDFGSAEVLNSGTQTRSFFINNHQDPSIILADVDLTSVSPPGSFEILSEPANTSTNTATAATITGHGTKTFTIRFNAVRLGQATASVVVRSNDVMHPAYTFAITGLALAPKISVYAVPEIYDEYTGQWIEQSPAVIEDIKPNSTKGNPPNPDNTPSATAGTFFGYNPLGNARRKKFYIRNDGNFLLRLTNAPGVNIIGPETTQYQLVAAPDTTLEAGEQTTFILEHMAMPLSKVTPARDYQINPGVLNQQLESTVVRIDSNDPAGQPDPIHNPFAFKINGYRNRTGLTLQALVLEGDGALDENNQPWFNYPRLATGATVVSEYYGFNPTFWSTDNAPLGPTIIHGQKTSKLSNRSDFGGTQVGGVITREFICRNDFSQEIALSGSPLVNISGSNASDYTVTLLGVYDATGVNKAGATANSATIAQWFNENPKPALAYHEYLRFSIAFRPADVGTRTCQVLIKTGILNVATQVIEKADPVLNVPEQKQTYTAFFNGKGLGPKIQVTNSTGVKIDRNDIPRIANSTLFTTECFICDRAVPAATGNTYTITNVGNQDLVLGQDTDELVRVIDMAGPNVTDFSYTQPVRNGASSRDLHPGESATFDVVFAPGPIQKDPQTGQEPEESFRFATVTIQSNDSPADNPQHRDGYVFSIRGTALDPVMRVRGHGQIIYDLDFSPRDTEVNPDRSLQTSIPREWDDTVFRDADVYGGQIVHTLLLRNGGAKHPLQILDPAWCDNEEIIYGVLPKLISETSVEIPGLQNVESVDNIWDFDPDTSTMVQTPNLACFGTREFLRCSPGICPNHQGIPNNYKYPHQASWWDFQVYINDRTLNTYASVLSRIREGDGAVVMGNLVDITACDPNIVTVTGATPIVPRDLLAPEDILRLRQNNPERYLPHSPVDEPYPRTTQIIWQDVMPILEDFYIPLGIHPYNLGTIDDIPGTYQKVRSSLGDTPQSIFPWPKYANPNADGTYGPEHWTLPNPFTNQFRYRTDCPVRGSVTLSADVGTNIRSDPDFYITRTSNDMNGNKVSTDCNDKVVMYSPTTLELFKGILDLDPDGLDRTKDGQRIPVQGDWLRLYNPFDETKFADYLIAEPMWRLKSPKDPRNPLARDGIGGAYLYNLPPYSPGGNGIMSVPRLRLAVMDCGVEYVSAVEKNGFFLVNTNDGPTKKALATMKPGFLLEFYPKSSTYANGDLSQQGTSNDPTRFHYVYKDLPQFRPPNVPQSLVGRPYRYQDYELMTDAEKAECEENGKPRPLCHTFTVTSIDTVKGIIRVQQNTELEFRNLKCDSNWGDGFSTSSTLPITSPIYQDIVDKCTDDGMNDNDPNLPYYEPEENGHWSATVPHLTMMRPNGSTAYYTGAFVSVIPVRFSIIDSNLNRVAFVKRDVSVVGYQRTDATGTQVTPPFSIAPGEEVTMNVRVRARWSVGFDRWNLGDRGFGPLNGWHTWCFPNELPPGRPNPQPFSWELGWDSYNMHYLSPENEDVSGSNFPLTLDEIASGFKPGFHPMGEHMVEMNIPNTDIDTYRNVKTGLEPPPPFGGHSDPIRPESWGGGDANGCYLDERTPNYEFTVLIEARDPRIRVSLGTDPTGAVCAKHFESHHPNWWPESTILGTRFAPNAISMASAPVGGTPIVRYLTIENGSPWLKGPIAISPNDVNYGTTNNGIVNYGYSGDGGEGFVQMPTQAGLLRLELDKGNPFILNGPPDFKVETVRTDNAPLFELQDRDLANQLNPVMWPMSPENGSTALNTDRVVLKITFTPNVVGPRQALLTIPSNDGSHPNLNITLLGSGTQSISN